MRGVAQRDFKYCKIGFNVHHGLRTHLGKHFACRTLNGTYTGEFAEDIVPQLVQDGIVTAMTPHFDRLDIQLEGVDVAMRFEGDRFELQDHRNWADANWKSYSTPLEYGFPMDLSAGQELFQRVSIKLAGDGPVRAAAADAVVSIRREDVDLDHRLPRLGHLLTTMPSAEQVGHLRRLSPDHLRVDLHPGSGDELALPRADRLARELGGSLEVGAFIRPDALAEDVAAVARAIASAASRIERVIVLAESSGFSVTQGAAPPELAESVRTALLDAGMPDTVVLSGTGQLFADINRARPDYSGIDGVVCSLNPQVHLSDDLSLMQNLISIPDIVGFARVLYPGSIFAFSPADLIGVNGPYPSGPSTDGKANQDPRQSEAFCAAWTLGAISQMVRCGADSATFFELVGARGLIDDRHFPVLDLFREIGRLRRRPLRAVRVSDDERVAALMFETDDAITTIVGNLTGGPLAVDLHSARELSLAPYEVVSIEMPRNMPGNASDRANTVRETS